MMEVIEDLPDGVVGIASKGRITKADYDKIVIPTIEGALKTHDKISVLFHLEDIEGMELSAMWEDTAFGLKHWSDFKRLALVSDVEWVSGMTAFFGWMIPAEVKTFKEKDVAAAREWVCTGH
ncbi:MAG: hypothetical protein CMH27_10985 [Micavibrio sp.]|nr:hypothetical protein [Micavibrio sp.]|tara:strand:+ start:2035 stop:2400 length:366 start_codon:yes stop_codon:yes gene_type:complete